MDTKNVVAGALVAQLALAAMTFGAVSLMARARSRSTIYREGDKDSNGTFWVAVLLLISLVFLLFTDEMSSTWMALFNAKKLAGFSRDTAMTAIFLIDIAITARLIYSTGGSIESPFQSVLFLVPALALLLYEPAIRVWVYSASVALVFLVCINAPKYQVTYPFWSKIAYVWVTLLSLVLAMVTGILTRSCPESLC